MSNMQIMEGRLMADKEEKKQVNINEMITGTRAELVKVLEGSGLPAAVLALVLENLLLQLKTERPK